MDIDFTGKRVLVTGGTRGIGRAIVEAFLDNGARVAVNGTTVQSVARAVSELDRGDQVLAAPGSLDRVEECRRTAEAALDGLGGLDVLVNNAGCSEATRADGSEEEIWNAVIDTNLKGLFFVTKCCLPALRLAKGNVVNLASILGLIGSSHSAVYCASKAGVINLTRSHAREFAPDVRVNAICPGGVDTDMLRSYAIRVAGSVEAGYAEFANSCVQKRIANVREIAGPVLYLASDLASFVTGSIHVVDGGEVI